MYSPRANCLDEVVCGLCMGVDEWDDARSTLKIKGGRSLWDDAENDDWRTNKRASRGTSWAAARLSEVGERTRWKVCLCTLV